MENNEINSEWFALTGKWDEKTEKYINQKITRLPDRILQMKIVDNSNISDNPDNKIIEFIGGPTGYETYYINDLLKDRKSVYNENNLCICAGTINSWYSCFVKWQDVFNFLKINNCV